MQLGAVFPTREIGTDPGEVRAFAEAAEAFGYHHLLTPNRDLGVNLDRPDREDYYGIEDAFHEPMVLFGHLAAVTDELRVVTGILVLPQRQTALVAKQAAAVDVLSGGRLRLGVGVGTDPVSYRALGVDWETRGARAEEQVRVLRALWTEELVRFDGDFHAIDDAGINPRPVQRPVPIWMGGGKTERVLRRVGRLADGWIPSGSWPVEEVTDRLAFVHDVMAEHGRDPAELAVLGRVAAEGEADDWLDRLSAWADAGATHVTVDTMDAGRDPAAHRDAIERFADVAREGGLLD